MPCYNGIRLAEICVPVAAAVAFGNAFPIFHLLAVLTCLIGEAQDRLNLLRRLRPLPILMNQVRTHARALSRSLLLPPSRSLLLPLSCSLPIFCPNGSNQVPLLTHSAHFGLNLALPMPFPKIPQNIHKTLVFMVFSLIIRLSRGRAGNHMIWCALPKK